jgi:hypothetical protein
MADRRRRLPVFGFSRTVCQRVQRLLSAAHDRSLAFDSSRNLGRISQSCPKRGLDSPLGFCLLSPACSSAFFSGRRLATLFAACLFALLALMLHGALWIQVKTSGPVNERAKSSGYHLVGSAGQQRGGHGLDLFRANPSEVLPARNSAYALTVQNVKAPEYGPKIGLLGGSSA